ncbi:MAG TPA: PEP-CTERM sorting domain-containing protein [Opitutaceae bacterium]|nr:PEP-CTERM sorting domain-containing protein [Opitutaceae bacterium]
MNIPPLLRTVFSVAGLLGLASFAQAQVIINTTGLYRQNFNTLPLSGTTPWVNNTTLAGWYAQRAVGTLEIAASTGSATGGALYSFGPAASPERALGSLGSSGTGNLAWGVIFQNTSLTNLTFTDVTFAGELWRRGATGKIDTIEFDYRLGPVAFTDLLAASGWTAVNALDFSNPNTAGGAAALDGNNAANRLALSSNLNLVLAPGQFVTFRWLDIDHTGTDNGIAIDDVSIAYVAAAPVIVIASAVPEPSTYGLFAAALLAGLAAFRRRRR